MINITDKKDCCGCTACASICPHNAITMKPHELGFLYPEVNMELCVNCGLCEKVCQFKEGYDRYENYDTPLVFALRHKDENQLKRSQSGGAFYAIAKYFIEKDAVVYGAAFDNKWHVHHTKATNLKELEYLRMSKYVQSDMRGVFEQVKNDLKDGLNVLFSGTSCQVAGLKSYIPNRLHKNLYCVDIVCHGVPSPAIWEDNLKYIESKYNSKITRACFRDKRFGWHGAQETYSLANGQELVRYTNNFMYFEGLSMRESCANCKFTNLERVGDLTAGDFWGIPKDSPFEKDEKGLSLLMVNSDKGKEVFEQIKNLCILEQSTPEQCLQPQLQRPSTLSPLHDKFIKAYAEHGFTYVAEHYGNIGWRYEWRKRKNKLRGIISRIVRKVIRK